jgi:hypothetical protein
MEQTECSETLAIKLHMPENNPKESIPFHSMYGATAPSGPWPPLTFWHRNYLIFLAHPVYKM